MEACLPPNETERLNALLGYEILDTGSEQEFDDLTLLASQVCATPISTITLVDAARQWFKSRIGLEASETPRSLAFCAHAILQKDVLIVADTHLDDRFVTNPSVVGSPGIRFYAGAPLLTTEGHALGTLCVADVAPRKLSTQQKAALQALGRQVVAQLELRRSVMDLRRKMAQLEKADEELRWKTAFQEAQWNASHDAIFVLDEKGKTIVRNGRAVEIFKIPEHLTGMQEPLNRFLWVANLTKDPAGFMTRVHRLQEHRDEVCRDEVEFKDGTVLDLYSGPVVGKDGRYYGRLVTMRDITERRRTEIESREKSSLIRIAGRVTRMGGWALSLPDHQVTWSDEMFNILEFPLGVMPALAEALALYPEPWLGRITAGIEACARDGTPYDLEVESLTRTGKRLWVRVCAEAERDTDGSIKRLQGGLQDITERRRAEEASRETEAKYRSIFDNASEGIFQTTPGGALVSANPALAHMLGFDSAEELIVERNDLERQGYADPVQRREFQRLLDETGLVMNFECEVRRRDGSFISVSENARVVRDPAGKALYYEGSMRDITERKRAEEELRLLSSAVAQVSESIVITDAQLDLPGPRTIFVNPAYTAMTGYTAAEAIGKTPRILQGPRTDAAVLRRLRGNLERGEIFEGEAINYRKDGSEFTIEWHVTPLRDEAGTVTRFMAIQRDISERKRLEAQLFESQKLETVGKLAGGIAHEFNSILTAIIGQSERLITELPAGGPLAKSATEISAAAGRAAALTRQLLAYGRKQMLQVETLNLNRVIAGMGSVLPHLLGSGVDIRVTPAENLQAVRVDAGQIEQVIMNMAINARDAMPNGGKLILETANVSFDEASVTNDPEIKPGNYVMLAITDTGEGMSAEAKARLFEPFFSTKGVGNGAGLGLSTCYGIIKQSGGHLTVYSELARGTVFKIYLPAFALAAGRPAQHLLPPELPRGVETILLVEDDPALREMATSLLERLGYAVLAAAHGLEALAVQQRDGAGHVDLLLTDLVMPHMSGCELAERVRELYPRTRILFTSAYTDNAIFHQGVLNEGVALLQKPFTPSALAKKLREVLDQPIIMKTEDDVALPR